MTKMIESTCKMCSGRGHRAYDLRKCTRCIGSGIQARRAPRKRQSDQAYFDQMNAKLLDLFGPIKTEE